MRENVDSNTQETLAQERMVFTEDLKNTSFLVDNKEEELDLLTAMIAK